MNSFTESVVEQAALAWLEALDYTILSGPEIAPPACRDEHGAARGEPAAVCPGLVDMNSREIQNKTAGN